MKYATFHLCAMYAREVVWNERLLLEVGRVVSDQIKITKNFAETLQSVCSVQNVKVKGRDQPKAL